MNRLVNSQLYTYQDALSHVGSQNKYQIRIFIILASCSFFQAIYITSCSFIFAQPEFICDGQPCKPTKSNCQGNIQIDPSYPYTTPITQFHLYCDRELLGATSESMIFLGEILGGGVLSYVADKYGRAISWKISWAISTIGLAVISWSQSVEMLIVGNFIYGFGILTTITGAFVILSESCSIKFRQFACISLYTFWGIAEILTCVVFYYMQHWRIFLTLVVNLPFILILICAVIWLKETPNFYSMKKEKKKFIAQLDYIATINNKPKFSEIVSKIDRELDPTMADVLNQQSIAEEDPQLKEKYNVITLFKYKSLRNSSLAFIIISYTLHLLYYGWQIHYLIHPMYIVNLVFQKLVKEIIYLFQLEYLDLANYQATVQVLQLSKNYPEKFHQQQVIVYLQEYHYVSYSLGGQQNLLQSNVTIVLNVNTIFLLLNQIFTEILVILIAFMIRFVNAFGFSLQGLYQNEVFPAVIRSTAVGFLFSVGIAGSFTAPYVIAFGNYIEVNPYIIIGFVCIAGPLATLLVKETLGRPLEDYVEEMQQKQCSEITYEEKSVSQK